MTSIQKVIKYLAIAFAIFLTVTIVSAILGGVFIAVNAFGLISNKNRPVISEDYVVIAEQSNNIVEEFNPKSIDIEVSATELEIKVSEKFKIETNNSDIRYKEENGKLKIIENEDNKWWFIGKNFDSKLVIYLPEKEEGYEEIRIKAGAGKIFIDKLQTKRFELDQGAGKVTISNLVVFEEAKLEGGAGEISIESGKIKNLRLNQGVGKTSIKAELTGNTDIDSGIGALSLELDLPKEAYRFKIEKGIGKVTLNDMKIDSDSAIGDGPNYIKIDGGIGSISVKTK